MNYLVSLRYLTPKENEQTIHSKISSVLCNNACPVLEKQRKPYYKIKNTIESTLMFSIANCTRDNLITLFSSFFGKVDEVNYDKTSVTIYKYDDLSKADSVFACMYVRFSP